MSEEDTIRNNLLAIASAYAAATDLSISTISSKFYGNSNFLTDFKAGKVSITASKLAQTMKAFRERWPVRTAWPKTVPIKMGRRGNLSTS